MALKISKRATVLNNSVSIMQMNNYNITSINMFFNTSNENTESKGLDGQISDIAITLDVSISSKENQTVSCVSLMINASEYCINIFYKLVRN